MSDPELFAFAWLACGACAWAIAEVILIYRSGFDPLDLLILPVFMFLGPLSFFVVWRLS